MFKGLLPENFDEFRSSDYWDKFFETRGHKPFEWYGEWTHLKSLTCSMCTAKEVLVIGCGNSELSAQMYDDGVENITNIDFSKVVIKEMMVKNLRARPKMKWLVMDMTQTKFEDRSFKVVFDKGGLDALMGEEDQQAEESGRRLLAEVSRVLDDEDGIYICVTLAQRQVLYMALSPLQPLVAIVRRMKPKAMAQVAVDFSRHCYGTNAEQMNMVWQVVDAENRMRLLTTTGDSIGQQDDFDSLYAGRRLSLQLPQDTDFPKYNVVVLDQAKDGVAPPCAVFIVPQGRECEWLYASSEGQWQVASQCQAQRVIMASVAPGHSATSLEALQKEMSPLVTPLIPVSVRFKPKVVPYVSVSDGVGKLVMREIFRSQVSGQVIVEDVEVDCGLFRRMVFGSSRSLVQSEVKLTRKKPGKSKQIPPPSHLTIQTSSLACAYHRAMFAGLHLLPDVQEDRKQVSTSSGNLNVLIVGMGGGGFTLFLHRHFNVVLEIVELDPAVIEAARKWFDLVEDKDLKVSISDGIEKLQDLAELGPDRYDALILDVGGIDNTDGMAYPPKSFLEDSFLENVKHILGHRGILIINFVARAKELYTGALQQLRRFFPLLKEIDVDEDLNHVVIAMTCDSDLDPAARAERIQKYVKHQWDTTSFQVETILEGLRTIGA